MSYRELTKTLTTDGSGDATDTFDVVGKVDFIRVDRTGGAAGTTFTAKGNTSNQNVLTLPAAQTDATYAPRVQASDPADGSDVAGLIGGKFRVNGLVVTVAAGGAANDIVVTVGFDIDDPGSC